MSKRPVALDLFCGACGGWSLGMDRAGFDTVAACEVDPWRRAVFSKNFPKVLMYDDVRTLSASRLVSDLGFLPDVIIGSPPCQDASAANTKGRGVDGDRTGLFFEAIRLVGECRPRWASFENVPGLRNRGADRVLAALEALGYAAEAHVVGASDIGANHERKRVWIIAFDPAQVGHGSWRPRRHWQDGDGAAYPQRRFVGVGHNPDEARCQNGPLVAGLRQAEVSDDGRAAGRRDARAAANADKDELRVEHGRRGSPRRRISAKPSDNDRPNEPETDRNGQSNGAVDAQMGGRTSAGGIAQEPWAHWNGGLAASLLLDAGLPAELADADRRRPRGTGGLAAAIVASFGDAVVPQITEAIGRAIWRVEAALDAVLRVEPENPALADFDAVFGPPEAWR
jgi:DNA (cytosine-5)-methyltransferase 1